MDALAMKSVLNGNDGDENTLNSPAKIIIKKKNIGLHEYQHQKYQYSLFNHNEKHDQFYDDLSKVKDRLERAAPNMQQVVYRDMRRARANQVYERKLRRDLNGRRGLNWQFKQEIQRLENDEREAERDLMRLNRDLARASLSSLSRRPTLSRYNTEISPFTTPHFSFVTESNSTIETSPRIEVLHGRPLLINTNGTAIDRLPSINTNQLPITNTNLFYKKLSSKFDETHPCLRTHANPINRQKREIEQKLRNFLH